MKKFIKLFNYIEEKFLAYTFVILIVIIFVQVILREIGHSNTWSEELGRYIYIWESWVGLSFCERHRENIRIYSIVEKFSGMGRKIFDLSALLLSVFAASFLIYYGIKMVVYLYDLGTLTPYIEIPNWIIYASLPVGCIAYVFRLLIDAYTMITGKVLTEHFDQGKGVTA